MEKKKRLLAAAVYILGAVVTAVLTIIRIFRIDIILFPDAMLPMQLYEQASIWLAWGFVPMTAASVVFYRIFHVARSRNRVCNTLGVFLPAVVCGGFLMYWIYIWVLMFMLQF